jgi:hypothetical protein
MEKDENLFQLSRDAQKNAAKVFIKGNGIKKKSTSATYQNNPPRILLLCF